MAASDVTTIDKDAFYGEYHGHRKSHLETLTEHFRNRDKRKEIIWLAGDSSLDSKFWFDDEEVAVNGYESVLIPARSKRDICHHLNKLIAQHGYDAVVINTAVEESTISDRERLASGQQFVHEQDKFLRDNIGEDDTLVISVGGNDIALRPSAATVWNLLKMTRFANTRTIETDVKRAFGGGHFFRMFSQRIQRVLERLCAIKKPKRIVVCMIYFPDETPSGGWADNALSLLGYRSNPAKLQTTIRALFEQALPRIQVDGVAEIVPFPMFEFLDGKHHELYQAGVEPSALGNELLAREMLPYLFRSAEVLTAGEAEAEDVSSVASSLAAKRRGDAKDREDSSTEASKDNSAAPSQALASRNDLEDREGSSTKIPGEIFAPPSQAESRGDSEDREGSSTKVPGEIFTAPSQASESRGDSEGHQNISMFTD